MSLTKEDLQAISDLIDLKLGEQDKRIQKRFDEQDKKFNKRFDEQDERFNKRFDEQDERFNKRFDEQDNKFEAIDKRFEAIDKRFDEQDEKIDKKLDNLKSEFKEMLIDNNILIAEHVQRVVQESEERLSKEIQEIKRVTADNCYNIVDLKTKIS